MDDWYLLCVLAWGCVGLLAYRKTCIRGWHGAGLVLCFVIALGLLHFVPGLLFLSPWYVPQNRGWSEQGFAVSTVGIIGFALGAFGLAPLLIRRTREESAADLSRVSTVWVASLIGATCYIGFVLGVGRVPSMTSVLSVGFTFVPIAACLALYHAYPSGKKWGVWLSLGAALLLPLFTIVSQGFLGYGVGYALIILCFFVSLHRRPLRLLALSLPLCFLGLSFYVAYMRDRGQIREAVWGGRGVEERLDRLRETITTIELFDPANQRHLASVDGRLNQNHLVGATISHLQRTNDFARGDTLWMAVVNVIPRAVWADKPVYAGSMDLADRFTGLEFARGTSVGLGLILEFYANFGRAGVFWGLLLIGTAVGFVDQRAGRALRRGAFRQFTNWMLVGTIFMNVGGSLAEIASSLAAAGVLIVGLNRFLRRSVAGEPSRAAATPPPRSVREGFTGV